MEQLQNYSSVVIDLSGDTDGITSVTKTATYDQAFLGEPFSDAKGKGRARKKKRKLERISNKREVRTERRKLKSDRGEERIARRKTRKEGRQDIRGEQQEARMTRRNKRRDDKESRKGSDEEQDEELDTTATDSGSEDSGSSDSGSSDSGSSDSGYGSSDNSSDDSEYSSDDSGTNDYDSEDDDSEDSNSSSSDDENFAGEQSNFVSELTGSASIPPMVETICMKIEWNNEMISRLMSAKKKMENSGADTSKVTTALGQKFDRVQELEGKLENFSGANGKVDKHKEKAVKQARHRARAKRMANVIPPVLIANMIKKGYSKSEIKNWWDTKGKHKFAKKNFEGTSDSFGTNDQQEAQIDTAYWETPAYDSNEANEVFVDLDNANEPMMNFSGSASGSGSNMLKTLLIGGIVGFTAIYFIRKYKLLK